MRKTTPHQFRQVEAVTSGLSDGLYEADRDLICGVCGGTIPANTYFSRKYYPGRKITDLKPACRTCKKFDVLTSCRGSVVKREDEYLFVKDQGEEDG